MYVCIVEQSFRSSDMYIIFIKYQGFITRNTYFSTLAANPDRTLLSILYCYVCCIQFAIYCNSKKKKKKKKSNSKFEKNDPKY